MFFFFIRPRRLRQEPNHLYAPDYYDINKKEQFDKLFGGLYIGEETLRLSATPIWFFPSTLPQWMPDLITIGLVWIPGVNIGIMNFCDRYQAVLPDDIIVRMKEECQG